MNQIQEIKEKYGPQAETIIAEGLGLERKGKKYRCPNGYAHRNNDKDPSMSWDPNALQFYCFGCGHKIDLYGYYKEHLNYTHQEIIRDLLGEQDYRKSDMQTSINTFKAESKKIGEINKDCIDYLKLRGLTEETMEHFNLGTYNGQIAFPYYKYDSLVGCKLRKPLRDPGKPKMTSITGSKPYLFNAQNIDTESNELVICEGEIDCMVIHQAGVSNVVSVGAGAQALPKLFEQSKDFLNKFEFLIIVSDMDKAGADMDKAFLKEFGNKAKLIDKKLYDLNDINEEYYKNGKERVLQIIDSARFKIEGRRDLEQQPYKGLTELEGKYIPTGISQIDYAMNDLAPRCLTLISGRSNGGKTTLVKQIMANAIDRNNKVYLMNGENDAEWLLNDFYQTVIGRDESLYDKVRINKRTRKEPKPHILKKLQEWHYKKLYMFNKGESDLKNTSELEAMIETEIKFNQYDLVVIDNLMSILSVDSIQKNEQQADFVQRLVDLAKNYNTHIILVLHPNKTLQKGEGMDFEQISGTSDMYNKADNIISVTREYDEEKIAEGINGYIGLLKNRYYPELPIVETNYDTETGLLLERNEAGDVLAYNFGRFNGNDFQEDEFEQTGFHLTVDPDCPF